MTKDYSTVCPCIDAALGGNFMASFTYMLKFCQILYCKIDDASDLSTIRLLDFKDYNSTLIYLK